MRALKIYDRLERVTLSELEQTERELNELDQGLRRPPEGDSLSEELARLKRYKEYLLNDLDHIRARREDALSIMKQYAAQRPRSTNSL